MRGVYYKAEGLETIRKMVKMNIWWCWWWRWQRWWRQWWKRRWRRWWRRWRWWVFCHLNEAAWHSGSSLHQPWHSYRLRFLQHFVIKNHKSWSFMLMMIIINQKWSSDDHQVSATFHKSQIMTIHDLIIINHDHSCSDNDQHFMI